VRAPRLFLPSVLESRHNGIKLTGSCSVTPVHADCDALGLSEAPWQGHAAAGFSSLAYAWPRMLHPGTPPASIQEQDIPLALAGRGVIGGVQMARNTAKVETERKGELHLQGGQLRRAGRRARPPQLAGTP
jgi:hypothetical protein